MSNPSNLYAEKIFSEHPLVLWALDDKSDYVSLITEAQRNIHTLWSKTDCTTAVGTAITGEPFIDSFTTIVSCSVPVSSTNTAKVISPELVSFQDLDSDLGTFSIGTHFYVESAFFSSVSIGYEYTLPESEVIVQEFKDFTTPIKDKWSFISGTFDVLPDDIEFRVIIKIITSTGGASSSDYRFFINGLTVGQWAEEFQAESLGVTPITFPNTINLTTTDKVIPAYAYGLSSDYGYYYAKGNAVLAKNTSIPMVYGASSVTKITPNESGNPSLIVPGKGFLNNVGRYKEYTAEFWIKVNSDATQSRRVFGPINDENGLYVDNGFLTLVIGNTYASHFAGEWFRPMLVHIRIISKSVTVLLNGEEVISMAIDPATLDLQDEFTNNKSNDWLGFYSYSDIDPIEIDCVAIYSYQVPTTVAKRRWVYGQGVGSSDTIDSAYGGTSAFIDYPFADYTANYNYPSFAKWEQGSFDNLTTTSSALTTPVYSLPNIFLDLEELQDFYDDNYAVQSGSNKFITFRPNGSWDEKQCYFNFNKLNVLGETVKTIYGVFGATDIDFASTQTLIKIYNQTNKNYFMIQQEDSLVKYILNYNGTDELLYTTEALEVGQMFSVGIQIDILSSALGKNVSAFFGNSSSLKVYVGGDENSKTFTGKIYSIGFCTSLNSLEVSDYFNSSGAEKGLAIFDDLSESGVTEETNAIAMLAHTASYTLLPTQEYGQLFLDIGCAGYWQDYLPLSYFAQYVLDNNGDEVYDLDFLQFNIGNPSPSRLEEKETTSSWTYQQLNTAYGSPTQNTYYQLDNDLYTKWNNYQDMNQRAVKYYVYNTDSASIKSYVTFQYVVDGANLLSSSFTDFEDVTEKRVIDVSDFASTWQNTKFEVVDNTLIYPDRSIDFNEIAIVYNLEFKARSTLHKPIKLRSLELASQAFSNNSFNPVGTRFGVNLFPYTRSGIYYDYKAKNPFSIYKGTTPYLYLNRKTGIEVRGELSSSVSRGISLPINKENATEYEVGAIQLWLRSEADEFPLQPKEMFEVKHLSDTIKFYFVANSDRGTRARIFAKNQSTGQEVQDLIYYWNGKQVREPVVTSKEWGALGISFSPTLTFDSFLGNISLTGPFLFNNVAFYQTKNLQLIQSQVFRPWANADAVVDGNSTWGILKTSGENYSWRDILVSGTFDQYGVNPPEVYNSYLGTNKIIIDDEDGLTIDADSLKIYNAVTWQTSVSIPI